MLSSNILQLDKNYYFQIWLLCKELSFEIDILYKKLTFQTYELGKIKYFAILEVN